MKRMTMQEVADMLQMNVCMDKDGWIYAFSGEPILDEKKGWWQKEEETDVYICLNDPDNDRSFVTKFAGDWRESLFRPNRKNQRKAS